LPITEEEYKLLTHLVKKLAQNKQLSDDLIQEVAIYWMELDGEKKKNIRDKGLVQAWFIRTIMNQDRSKTSYFYRKYKTQPTLNSDDLGEIMEDTYTEDELEEKLDLVKAWIEDLFPSDKNIIKDYYEKGLTIMGISAKYQVDKNYTVSVLTRVKASFYRLLIWRQVPKSIMEIFLIENIAPLVGKKRLKAEERQFVIDSHNFLYKTNHNAYFDLELCSYLLKSLIQKLHI
jgi:DNA-directed RNA polymerase specialized sigma24 family protein